MADTTEVQASSARLYSAILSLVLAAAALGIAVAIHVRLPLNHDVAIIYYAAAHIWPSGDMSLDLIAPNAPLVALSMLPAVWIASLGLSPADAVLVYGLFLAATVVLLCRDLLRAASLPTTVIAAALFVTLAVLPAYSFMQRDQMVSLLLVPYVLSSALRSAGVVPRRTIALLSGVLAGLAVSVKPPYLPLLIVADLFIVGQRPWRRVIRREAITAWSVFAGITALSYGLFPDYLASLTSRTAAVTEGLMDIAKMSAKSVVAMGLLVAILLCGTGRFRGALRPVRRLFLAEAATALLVFVLQTKGWGYQFVPAMSWIVLSLVVTLALYLDPAVRGLLNLARAAMATFLLAGSSAYLLDQGMEGLPLDFGLRAIIAETPGPFVILSSSVVPGFPLAVETDHIWASRYPGFIILPGLVKAAARDRESPWEQRFRAGVAEDFDRFRPPLVVVRRDHDQALPADFDLVGWLSRDPAFERIWRRYHRAGAITEYDIYRAD